MACPQAAQGAGLSIPSPRRLSLHVIAARNKDQPYPASSSKVSGCGLSISIPQASAINLVTPARGLCRKSAIRCSVEPRYPPLHCKNLNPFI